MCKFVQISSSAAALSVSSQLQGPVSGKSSSLYVHQEETRKSVHRKNFFAAIALVHNLKEEFGVAHDHGSAVAFVSVTGIGCPFSS